MTDMCKLQKCFFIIIPLLQASLPRDFTSMIHNKPHFTSWTYRTIRTALRLMLTVCVLLYTWPPVPCQLQLQHPMHSGCKHCTSRSELHGIGDTSLMLHDHFWLPDAKRCPERRGEERRKLKGMWRFLTFLLWTRFLLLDLFSFLLQPRF